MRVTVVIERLVLLGRIRRIFQRYAEQNLRLADPGRPLRDASGTPFGRLDRVSVAHNRLVLEGWTAEARIGVVLGRNHLWCTPDLPAPDLPAPDLPVLREGEAAPGTATLRGFTLDIPFEPGPFAVVAETAGRRLQADLPGFGRARVQRCRALLWGPYLRELVRLVPQIRRWKLGGDLGAREVIKERLGLVPASDATEMRADVLIPDVPLPAPPFPAVTLLMPVYNAFDLLPEALDRVARHTDLDWRLILIEDASSDPRVAPFVAGWAAAPERAGRVTLLHNPQNLGFIGSVNRGLAEARAFPGDPVILLNSDAMVPAGWASRLTAPLAAPDVASVTPLSNDAEIFTVPAICRRAPLPAGAVDVLDAAARALNPAAEPVAAPTGVGFCMALSPRFLALLPGFDPAFGRGYGEETDWCQKARQQGGRHLCAHTLFVEHRGGASFGAADKQKLLDRNGAEISRRYPGYDREVQEFIRHDPLNTVRLALGLVWAALHQPTSEAGPVPVPVPVYLGHAMGGGADHDLKARIGYDLAAGGSAVVLRVGQGHRWKLELHTAPGVTQGLTDDEALVRDLLARLPARRIVYSCGVAARDAFALPGVLLDLAGRGAQPLPGGPQPVEVLCHDFLPVSPSYTLLGQDGVYRGVPLPGTAAGADPAHVYERPGGAKVDLAGWQAAWRRLLAVAERITVFSHSSHAILAEVFPEVRAALQVTPHRLRAAIPRIAPARAPDGRPVIGVLGNIGLQKGAAVLQRLSRDLARNPRAGLVVIGQFDPAYPLATPARIHGSYELRDLPGLVARYGISAWLIPSVWPETFSFTTHEALATGLPVFAFDLGAQGDTVRAAGWEPGLLPLSAAHDGTLAGILCKALPPARTTA